MSPSSRGRGLKFPFLITKDGDLQVALFTRAWIEMEVISVPSDCGAVALFTRAWIEIGEFRVAITAPWSPSSRGRGLK